MLRADWGRYSKGVWGGVGMYADVDVNVGETVGRCS
jgi:hypothetical protein